MQQKKENPRSFQVNLFLTSERAVLTTRCAVPQFASLEDGKRPEKKELICCHHRNDPSFCLGCCRPLKCNMACITVHFPCVWSVAVGLGLQDSAGYAPTPQSHRSGWDGQGGGLGMRVILVGFGAIWLSLREPPPPPPCKPC